MKNLTPWECIDILRNSQENSADLNHAIADSIERLLYITKFMHTFGAEEGICTTFAEFDKTGHSSRLPF